MARRSISVTQIQVHRRYQTDDHCDLAALPDDADLLHLVHGLLRDSDRKHLVDTDSERYNSVENMMRSGRTLTLDMTVGRFGDQGWTRNVESHQVTHEHGGDEAHTVRTRALLVVPKKGTSALLFNEHASNIGGGRAVLNLLRKAWKGRYPDWTLKFASLVESEAWLQHAQLESVTAVLYGWNSDIADTGQKKVIGDLRHTLEPPKGRRFFPETLWHQLRDNKIKRGKLLGFGDETEPEEVKVTLEHDNLTKTFVLGNEKTPAVRYAFADNGDPMPSTEYFRNFCLDETKELFKPLGCEWKQSWAAGAWSKEALEATMAVPDGD